MTWDAVGLVLLGSGLTLLAQWFGLRYETRRQREARRADFQRTTLIQVRDLLGEVEEALGRAMGARAALAKMFEEHAPDPSDEKEWRTYLYGKASPELTRLRSLSYRLRLLAAGVEHKPLGSMVWTISKIADQAPLSFANQEAENAHVTLIDMQDKTVELLGQQLQELP
jgi:hypothetical protein